MKYTKLNALVLAAVMLFSMFVVGYSDSESSDSQINVMVLNGTTGFGMANLIADAKDSKTELNYNITVETDASNVTAALVNGSADIAALPTNAAAAVYNKTEGAVQIIAINTKGVLYLVADKSVEINTVEDLKGMTVYAPAQNPSFIFGYICEQNGLKAGEDVVIDNTYAQPAELNAAVASGTVKVAVLPEPMVTVAKMNNPDLAVVMDLTEEWNKTAPEGSLVQGCVVVRKEFAEAHPDEIGTFLKEYEMSVNNLLEDNDTAAANIEAAGILAKAAIAKKAIPNCNICFISGDEMKAAMADFLNIMMDVAPKSIGGNIPADDFYYVG